MPENMANPVPPQVKLVRQEAPDTCGIACAAMIASVSYREAWQRLAPPPTRIEFAAAYRDRELAFFSEKGWWPSAQFLLNTVVGLGELDSKIDADEKFKEASDRSQRIRLILAFPDGTKPDHYSVVWDRNFKDLIFDPSRGKSLYRHCSTTQGYKHI